MRCWAACAPPRLVRPAARAARQRLRECKRAFCEVAFEIGVGCFCHCDDPGDDPCRVLSRCATERLTQALSATQAAPAPRDKLICTHPHRTIDRKVRGQCEPRVQCEPRKKFDYAFPASAAADAGNAYFSALTASAENMRHRLRMRISSAVHDEPPRFTLTPHLPTNNNRFYVRTRHAQSSTYQLCD